MKKLFVLLIFAMTINTGVYAWKQIPFTVCIEDDDMPIGSGHSKSPLNPPTVYIEDYILSFETGHPDYVLYIKDEDGNVVYTTTVFSTTTLVALPSTLSGNYEIELTMGNWIFTGWIEL